MSWYLSLIFIALTGLFGVRSSFLMNSEHKVLIDLKASKLISPFRAIFRNPEGTSGPVLTMNHETGG